MLKDSDITDILVDYALNGTPEMACRALWLRVLQYAKMEVCSKNVRDTTKKGGAFLQKQDQKHALLFLQGKLGELEAVCDLAGVSSNLIKKWANCYEEKLNKGIEQ